MKMSNRWLAVSAFLAAGSFFSPWTNVLRAQAAENPPAAVKVDPAPVADKPGTLTSFAPIVQKVAPSVVTISTSKNVRPGPMRNNPLLNDPTFRRFFGIPDEDDDGSQPLSPPQRRGRGNNNNNNNNNKDAERSRRQPMGLGSGVIVSPDGHILTNNHVVEGADDIVVTIGMQTHEYKAKKVGTDPQTDLAVLKIEANNLPAVTFGDSDKIRVGDIAIAVGNPFGLTQSVSMGVVSATGRSVGIMGAEGYENFIQTDASINPGNSGGALVDIEGRLIGINTAIFSRTGGNQGIGFAVPSNLAHGIMASILKNGRVVRGYLGTGIQPLTEELASEFKIKDENGALVSEVRPDSPAAKAGIATGDVITEVDGRKIEGPRELRLLVGSMAPGTKVNVKLTRDGQQKVVPVELGELPGEKNELAQTKPDANAPDVLDGVTVADIDDTVRKELEIPEGTKGVVITNVEADSPSAAAGLKRGDVILEIEKQPVSTAKQAVDLSEKLKTKKKVLLRVSSKGQSHYVIVGNTEE
jgi:serine protease Do